MKVSLPYGKKSVDIDLNGINATVLEPKFVEGVAEEKAGFMAACEAPIGSAPLKDLIRSRSLSRMRRVHFRAIECFLGYSKHCHMFPKTKS
jgi:hypothetical protein